jgi:hypothetical protein
MRFSEEIASIIGWGKHFQKTLSRKEAKSARCHSFFLIPNDRFDLFQGFDLDDRRPVVVAYPKGRRVGRVIDVHPANISSVRE